MATVTDVKKDIVTAPQQQDIRHLIKSSIKELARALPAHMTADRVARIALTCIRLNPDLANCTPESFMGSLFTSAQLGLEPIGGRAFLLPFNRNIKVNGGWKSLKECVFVVGYKGLVELFYRHAKSVELVWGVVHEKDSFSYEYGTNATLRHIPADGDRGAVKHLWAMASLQSGGKPFLVMTKNECMDHGRKHSKTYDKKEGTFYKNSPWATSEDMMCLKTVLIQLGKLLPLSIEFQRAIQADETARNFREGVEDALDIVPEPFDQAEEPEPIVPVTTLLEKEGDAQE